ARSCDSVQFTASCGSSGGNVEVWLDSIDTGKKIATCTISPTEGWLTYNTFTTSVTSPVKGTHDVYLKFIGTGTDRLFQLLKVRFIDNSIPLTSAVTQPMLQTLPLHFALRQNYPNPFNPSTTFSFVLPSRSFLTLGVYDVLGRKVSQVLSEELPAGSYTRQWNAEGLPSGFYFYRLTAGSFTETRKLLLMR
ncbi:MAG TPA: carbohydrate-binding protein, partial [Bacteroidota bacterium]|nr:carbohydrate-binding protein [Bacteroidota bacterium]